jgi:hypothetical protein
LFLIFHPELYGNITFLLPPRIFFFFFASG